jgi:nucleotide-binding universal stress UspA family protein
MSYRTIFSVINEHSASTVTARYAIALAVACKSELFLYAAHNEVSAETKLHQTERHMDYLFTVAFELDIAVKRITEVGDIKKLLPKRVQAEKADLVLYPLMPDDRYGTTLRLQTVHYLLRSIKSDLAIMRAIAMANPHPAHIQVPLGKVISNKGGLLLFVTELAKSFNAQVTLFHISKDREAEGIPEDIIRFRKQLQLQGIAVVERMGRGDIGKSIIVEAITRHNDLIILGASGRGMLRSLFNGNPAGDVMHQPPCDTILFRPAP